MADNGMREAAMVKAHQCYHAARVALEDMSKQMKFVGLDNGSVLAALTQAAEADHEVVIVYGQVALERSLAKKLD